MSREAEPTVETLRVIARDLGLDVDSQMLEAAAHEHQGIRGKLEEFRRVRLPYLDALEPGHVVQWIAQGGRVTTEPTTSADEAG
jgi:hypothetical protein